MSSGLIGIIIILVVLNSYMWYHRNINSYEGDINIKKLDNVNSILKRIHEVALLYSRKWNVADLF